MIEDFEERWRALIRAGDVATREVDADSPIRMICGLDATGSPIFFIVVERKPGLPQLSGAIHVERRQRGDGRWTLTLVLNDHTLTDVFISLVADLALRCVRATSEERAVTAFLETVQMWQDLLRARFHRLSEERLRGLIAELWFGYVAGHHGHSLRETVDGWSGPFGGDQDYVFPAPAPAFEVKSVRPSRDIIEISSARQLDIEPLKVAVVTLDRSPEPLSTTLPGLVKSIRHAFAEPELRIEFNRRFAELMVDLNDPWYADQTFSVLRLRTYAVGASFPAIRESQLPDAIPSVRYHLALEELDEFRVHDEAFLITPPQAGEHP